LLRRRNLAPEGRNSSPPRAKLVAVLLERRVQRADERPLDIAGGRRFPRPRLWLRVELLQSLGQETGEAMLHLLRAYRRVAELVLLGELFLAETVPGAISPDTIASSWSSAISSALGSIVAVYGA
jgi:hypothetical protein